MLRNCSRSKLFLGDHARTLRMRILMRRFPTMGTPMKKILTMRMMLYATTVMNVTGNSRISKHSTSTCAMHLLMLTLTLRPRPRPTLIGILARLRHLLPYTSVDYAVNSLRIGENLMSIFATHPHMLSVTTTISTINNLAVKKRSTSILARLRYPRAPLQLLRIRSLI